MQKYNVEIGFNLRKPNENIVVEANSPEEANLLAQKIITDGETYKCENMWLFKSGKSIKIPVNPIQVINYRDN